MIVIAQLIALVYVVVHVLADNPEYYEYIGIKLETAKENTYNFILVLLFQSFLQR